MFLYYCSSYLSKSGQMKSFPKSDPGMFDPLPSLPAPALVLPPDLVTFVIVDNFVLPSPSYS